MTRTVVPDLEAVDDSPAPNALTIGVARAVVLALAAGVRSGTLVLDEGGRRHRWGAGEPVAHVAVHDARAFVAVARHGSIGLGDAYIRGWWDADDLTAFLRIALRALRPVLRVLDMVGTVEARFVERFGRPRTSSKHADRDNIRAHYDLGNEFFALMLDETMMYSCAVFDRPHSTLLEASTAKLDRMCRLVDLGPEDHVVEIGTGWGGFAVHAARRYGCRVTTTTISDAQFEHATKRIADLGLSDRVTVRNDDYRDLDGRYDKLVSIEMIEAVDWPDHDTFFAACARLVRPGGVVGLQAIVIKEQSFDRAKLHEEFVKRAIFPGGCLPSLASIVRSGAIAGLRVRRVDDIGDHYPTTLRHWWANVESHRDEVAALGLGAPFLRLWALYLSYCEAGFLERHVSDVQVLLTASGPAGRA